MSWLRPNTSSRGKTAQARANMGTASRLTTGNQMQTNFAASLNTSVNVEDRPITQQGLTGLKTASKGPRRQVEDKSYYLGLVRQKMNEIHDEINKYEEKTTQAEDDNANFLQYEQMAEKLASEIEELQGELGDCNTLVDKANLGGDISSVQQDFLAIKETNEKSESVLERLFENRQAKMKLLESCELELKQEKEMAENVVHEMDDDQCSKFMQLRTLNQHLLGQISNYQKEMDDCNSKKCDLEEEVCRNRLKQEILRLYVVLRELEDKKDQLVVEDSSLGDPAAEKENLLKQVREDNQEITRMENEIRELQDKIQNNEDELRNAEQDLNEMQSERAQEYRELKDVEKPIDDFINKYDEIRERELATLSLLGTEVEELLDQTSKNLMNTYMTIELRPEANESIEALKEQLEFKSDEVSNSKETVKAINQDRFKLQNDFAKISHFEEKLVKEKDYLQERIPKLEEEIKVFNNTDKILKSSEEKKKSLSTEKCDLDNNLNSMKETNIKLLEELNLLKKELSENETYLQLQALEKQWTSQEQVNYGLMEFIATKKQETDHSFHMTKVMDLMNTYNQKLIDSINMKVTL